jgi:hypothetical protein
LVDERYGQAHHVEITPLDAVHEFGGKTLDTVGARFVERFTTLNVVADFLASQVVEGYMGGFMLEGFNPIGRAN